MSQTATPQPGPPNAAGNPTSICTLCDPPKPITVKNYRTHQANVHGKGGTVTKIGQRAFKKKGRGVAEETLPVQKRRSYRSPAKRASGARKRAVAARASGAVPIVLTPADGGPTTFRVLDNFIVLAGSDGHIYVAERVK